MILIAAFAVLSVTVLAGMGLGVLHLLKEKPPGRLTWKGALHGLGGVAGLSLLLLALSRPGLTPSARAVRMGAGGFAYASGVLICIAFAGGLAMLVANLRRRPMAGSLVAAHSVIAIAGYVILATYFTMIR